MWRILKNPLAQELSYEYAAEFILEAIKIIGAPVIYETKVSLIELNNYKCEVPCDLLYIEGVRYCNDRVSDPIPMREASNLFHLAKDEFLNEENTNYDLRSNHRRNEFTYLIQKGVLFSSMRDGFVEIAYKSIITDEDGFPMVPDQEEIILFLEYYVLSRYLEPLWMMGKITDKAFEYIQQKRYFYCASAETKLKMPSIDKMETIMNGINKIIINSTAHENSFKKYGEKERLRKFR